MISLDDLAKIGRANAIVVEASPFDVDQRRVAFGLLGERIKRDGITRLPNGRWKQSFG